jgi:hypothetical protein
MTGRFTNYHTINLPEPIPPERAKEWHAFLATLPPGWWEGKTADERGVEAMRLWKEDKNE